MITILNNMFGTYEPLKDAAGNTITDIAGLNVPWITCAVLLTIIVYSLFRLLGAVFK